MQITLKDRTNVRGGKDYCVSVHWPGYGFDRNFQSIAERDAYVQAIEDFQDAMLNAVSSKAD